MESSASQKSVIPLTNVEGHMVPHHLLSVDITRQAMSFKPRPDDVILVSYPRSGTHWTAYIIWSILNNGRDIPDVAEFNRKEAPFLEIVGTLPEDMSSPRFSKTHIAYLLASYKKFGKKIWNIRNPFDCCVSFYFFFKEVAEEMKWENPNFDDYFSFFLEGQVPTGSYFDHFISCFHQRNDSNVLHITYENMKGNPMEGLFKIARFLGEEYYQKIVNDETLAKKILHNTSFDIMKDNINFVTAGPGEIHGSSDIVSLSQKSPDDKNKKVFLRKGVVGDWKKHFSDEQEKRMRDWIQKNLNSEELQLFWKELGYDQI